MRYISLFFGVLKVKLLLSFLLFFYEGKIVDWWKHIFRKEIFKRIIYRWRKIETKFTTILNFLKTRKKEIVAQVCMMLFPRKLSFKRHNSNFFSVFTYFQNKKTRKVNQSILPRKRNKYLNGSCIDNAYYRVLHETSVCCCWN